jgi:hypothetical protein
MCIWPDTEGELIDWFASQGYEEVGRTSGKW